MPKNIKRDTLSRLVSDYSVGEFERKQKRSRWTWLQNIVQVLNDTTGTVYAGGILRVDGFLYPDLDAEKAEESYRTYGTQLKGVTVTHCAHEPRVIFADCCEKKTIGPAYFHGIFGSYVYNLKTVSDACPGGEFHRFVRYDTYNQEHIPALADTSCLADYQAPVTRPYRLIGSHGGPWEIIAISKPSNACGERRHFCLLCPAWSDVRIGVIANGNGFATDDPSNVWSYSPLQNENKPLAEVILSGDVSPFFCFSPFQAYNTTIPRGTHVAIAVDQSCGQTNIISAECF